MGAIASSLEKSLDLILPRVCVACEKSEGSDLCKACSAKISPLTAGICCFCRNPLPTMEPGVCAICSRRLNLKSLLIARSYDKNVMKPAVHALKYEGISGIAPIFAQLTAPLLAAARANRTIPHTLFMVPIPLPTLRRRTRGYNQTALIASALRALPIPDLTLIPAFSVLVRYWSFAQANLPAKFRQENIATSFQATLNLHEMDILLIDDVTTTGATFAAAASALHLAGAARIYGLAVAKG